MKRSVLLLLSLAVLSVASGVLMSHSSWIGKVGITFMHQEYNFTKIWWQGATGIYLIVLLLFGLHLVGFRKLNLTRGRMLHLLMLLLAGAGLYFTYADFHTEFTHKLLRSSFHYGVYLFWVQWMIVALFFLFKKKLHLPIIDAGSTVPKGV